MKINWKSLLICLAIPLALGALVAFLTMDAMKRFPLLNQPPLSPPMWLFPVVWTLLYLMMGLASYLVWQSAYPKEEKKKALTLYGIQLAVNLAWPFLFFELGWYGAAFCWLLFLWVLLLRTMFRFFSIEGKTVALLLPYLLWITFAGYLNLGIALLN